MEKKACLLEYEEKAFPFNYRAMKKWVFCLLERPNTKWAVLYHSISLLLITGSLIVGVLHTIESLEEPLHGMVIKFEVFLLVWFSLEFAFRLWACSYISRYQGIRGRLCFLMSLYMMIDIFVILSTAITLLMQVNGNSFATILRVTRFMQVFRILRVDRQRGDIRTMGNVVRKHCKELITVYFVGFVLMFSATYLVYLCEKHISQNDAKLKDEVSIDNMADGLYWAEITVSD